MYDVKIHKLEIENIASLKGKHKIDFDALFTESSLFAITGKTGSGKSTILNCLSLALFGKVYKDDSQHTDFITLGESSGSIILEFSNLGKSYQSSWHLKLLKKNGDAYKKPPLSRKLALIIEEDELRYIETNIEDILHLTFDQFCKTTILNQGQFAKLLTSSFNERKDILEKFYNGIDLELLNVKLLQKLRERKSVQNEIQNQILGFTQAFEEISVSKEELAILKKKKEDFLTLKSFGHKCLKDIQEFKETLKSLDTNTTRLSVILKELSEFEKEFNKLKQSSDSIQNELTKQSQTLTKKRPILMAGARSFQENTEAHKQKSYREEELTNLKKKDAHLKKEQSELTNQIIKFDEELEQIKIQIPIITTRPIEDLEQDINDLVKGQEESTREKQSYQNLLKSDSELKTKQEKLKQELEQTEKKLANLKTNTNQIQLKKDKEKIQNLLTFNAFQKRAHVQLDKLNLIFKETSKKEEEKLVTLAKAQETREQLEKDFTTQKRALDFFSLATAIHQCEEESIEKNHCVVCHRDLPENFKVIEKQSDKEKEIIEQEKILTQQKLDEVHEKYNALKVEKLTLSERKERIRLEQKELKGSLLIEKQANHLPIELETQIKLDKFINDFKINIEKSEKSLKEQQALTQELKYLQKNMLESETLSILNKQELTKQKSKLESDNKNQNKLIKKLSLTESQQNGLKDLLEKIRHYSKVDIKKNLSHKDLLNIIKNSKALQEQQTKYQIELKEIEVILAKTNLYLTTHFESNQKDPNDELLKLEQVLQDQKTTALENEKMVSKESIKLADIKYRITSYKDQISGLELIVESIKHKLQEQTQSLKETKLSDISLQEIVAPLIKIVHKLQSIEKDDQLSLAVLEESYQSSSNIYREIEASSQEQMENLSAQLALFHKKQENEKRIDELQKKKGVSDNDINSLNDLYSLIGKDSFRNYILSLIENTLIDQTNKELENLYQGRYSLSQTHKKNKSLSEFIIIDYFKDGMSRKVSTLSGGETFLVSLAMALALAELTRGQTEIDSLFIDEGFGTLDSDSIDEVFELLEAIQHSGKQIGIISHVQNLTSRIGININLNKSSEGSSKVDILYN